MIKQIIEKKFNWISMHFEPTFNEDRRGSFLNLFFLTIVTSLDSMVSTMIKGMYHEGLGWSKNKNKSWVIFILTNPSQVVVDKIIISDMFVFLRKITSKNFWNSINLIFLQFILFVFYNLFSASIDLIDLLSLNYLLHFIIGFKLIY